MWDSPKFDNADHVRQRYEFIIDALKGHLETAISTLGMCSECGGTENHKRTCGLAATIKAAEKILE